MGNIIDITEKLTEERPSIKIGDKIFPVDNSKNTMLKINELTKQSSDFIAIDQTIALALGNDALDYISQQNYSVTAYHAIFIAIIAAITGEESETMEARFHK